MDTVRYKLLLLLIAIVQRLFSAKIRSETKNRRNSSDPIIGLIRWKMERAEMYALLLINTTVGLMHLQEKERCAIDEMADVYVKITS